MKTAEELRREAIEDEARRARWARFVADTTCAVLAQQHDLTLGEGLQCIARARQTILGLFPGKVLAFNILYRARFVRILVERFGIPEDEIQALP
jgi:hypothetical protein